MKKDKHIVYKKYINDYGIFIFIEENKIFYTSIEISYLEYSNQLDENFLEENINGMQHLEDISDRITTTYKWDKNIQQKIREYKLNKLEIK